MSDAAKAKLRAYGIAPPHTRPAPDVSVMRFIKRPAADVVSCPHCGSSHTVVTSQFGSTACKALYKCLDCQEPFDYFKPY
jgi:ring-1,2-phenylacetyl-CoA epoxidase subunit PaaD